MVKVYDMGTYAVDERDCEMILTVAPGNRHVDQLQAFPALQLQEIEMARPLPARMPTSMQGIALAALLDTQD